MPQRQLQNFDNLVHLDWTKEQDVKQLDDDILLGEWFIFFKQGWHIPPKTTWQPEGILGQLLSSTSNAERLQQPLVLFRGNEKIQLPAVSIDPKPLPQPTLISLTCDKSLYRVQHDTVHLLIASPQTPQAELTLSLSLHGTPFANYPVKLDQYGMALQKLNDLPEGEYRAELLKTEAGPCHFEVAEYRLSPLNAELVAQELSHQTLRYTLSITAFNQPYSGPVEIELTEEGNRVGARHKINCNAEGLCQGAVNLTGSGPYALNIIVGERTATVSLKGSEQQRRETLLVSELGEEQELSLLPLPQANVCRGMFITHGGHNNEPFLVKDIIGQEIEIIARCQADLLSVTLVDPARGTSEQKYYSAVAKGQCISLPVPSPYGMVLLGAIIDGEPWEGWCAVVHPSNLDLRCEAPKEAKPGERITITLTTNITDRVVPVHIIVKDQRLIATSDPQVELAAHIKKNLSQWSKASITGKIERKLSISAYPPPPPMPLMSMLVSAPSPIRSPAGIHFGMPARAASILSAETFKALSKGPVLAQTRTEAATLTKVRLNFPEVIYNSIVYVQGSAHVEVRLGDSLARYAIEAFALEPVTLDWQRIETTINAVQPVYGELTLSPFVFPGDPVMGQLHVGASSGAALAEVRHDDEVLPLFDTHGKLIPQGSPIATGEVVRFPVRPGAITAIVRDASREGSDVSERYVTAPGKMRHIKHFLRLITPGESITRQDLQAMKLQLLPGLEHPFSVFVEAASAYPYGCIEQTSSKLLAMFTGYIINQHKDETAANTYAAVLPVWFKRLQSMYVPNDGFAFYPPEETGGKRTRSNHYAPLAVKHLLKLPTAQESGVQRNDILDMLTSIRAMANDAAKYHKVDNPPTTLNDCHAAYRIAISQHASPKEKQQAITFVRNRLHKQGMHACASLPANAEKYYGTQVATRAETAYAAATLIADGALGEALPAANYVIEQLNEEGRLYSTIDSAACLALLLELRKAGITEQTNETQVLINNQEMPLSQALTYEGQIESLRCLSGLATVQVTEEATEDWSSFDRTNSVKVHIEKDGGVQPTFVVGDALDLVVRVPNYEPGLVLHVCLPDALARVVGGAQVKRFSLDFRGQNELRIPLAAVSPTILPGETNSPHQKSLLHWLDLKKQAEGAHAQHWAVIVRNMFNEEAVGNPGLLEVVVKDH